MGTSCANVDLYASGVTLGQPCNGQADCPVGFCTDGVCCFVAACPAPADACHAQGTCTAGTGLCGAPTKPDGTACDDGNACTMVDSCMLGACTGGGQVDCAPGDACHDPGVCDPMTGVCSNAAKPDGAPCKSGDLCSMLETCFGGVCSGELVDCAPLDECHSAGVCDSATGQCPSPVKPDGEPCTGGVCQNGICSGTTGTGGSGAGGGGSGGTGGDLSVKGGCGCRATGGEGGSVPGVLGLGLAALIIARRRRRSPQRPV
jgi:MYXO-CTERM domain-containing protein